MRGKKLFSGFLTFPTLTFFPHFVAFTLIHYKAFPSIISLSHFSTRMSLYTNSSILLRIELEFQECMLFYTIKLWNSQAGKSHNSNLFLIFAANIAMLVYHSTETDVHQIFCNVGQNHCFHPSIFLFCTHVIT